MKRFCVLNGNMLKIIAAVTMTIDHVGVLFFPYSQTWLRIVGRLAFPIFAFMISECARYTRSRARYFLTIFGLGAVCQAVYYIFMRSTYMSILMTFSVSILLIYALQEFKRAVFDKGSSVAVKALLGAVFFGGVIGSYFLMRAVEFDYGFIGCMIPVLASLFDFRGIDAPEAVRNFDRLYLRVACLTLGVAFHGVYTLIAANNTVQIFALLGAALLFLYSGERGRLRMKYFFYVFYPAHLVILEGIYLLIYRIL